MYSYRYRPSPGSRLAALLLSLAICALIVLALISMGLLDAHDSKVEDRLTAVTFAARSAHQAHKIPTRKAQAAMRRNVPRLQPKPPVSPNPEPVPPLNLLKLTREEFAAADIGKMARRPGASTGDAGQMQGDAGAGEGPGGARLYNAEWYREPTRAELITYMPHRNVAGGWAMIACRTQEGYRVDDCQELGESPPGSGLSRALRQASWQFLVRPPRIDGRPLIGAWVRIRFDFTKAPAGEDGTGG